MKFKKDTNLNNYLDELLSKHELNLSISDMLTSLLGNTEITCAKEIELLMHRFHFSARTVFFSKITRYFDIDLTVEDNDEIFNRYVLDTIHELEPNKYLNNPYYQAIKDINVKDGDYEIKVDKYQAFEIFAYQDMTSKEYVEINSLGYFKESFSFITLNHKGVTWMNITPNEIETMQKAVDNVKGDVLVFGLGLGYFPFMASLKSEVRDITIIENDKTVIKLFEKYLLPYFPHKEKITILYGDANDYLNKSFKADYAFIDLWHSPEDGIDFFLKFKSVEKKYGGTTFFYWLESSFYLYLRRLMFTLIGEQLDTSRNYSYSKAETIEDKIINTYYQKTKNLLVENKEDVDKLLSEDTLLNLLLND